MSGHNKWSTIKRKKGAQDAKRSKIFSRLVKEIQIAAREGGADPTMNPRLRLAIQNAKGANMPKDNIERAISKGSSDDTNYQEITFEGYAPHGVGIFIECLTDNKNRTVSNIRAIFTKKGGSLGTNGSLKFVFDRKGVFTIPKGVPENDYDRAMKNLAREEMKERGKKMPMDGSMNYRHQMQQQVNKAYWNGGYMPNNWLNPFAWAKFFKAWKEGKFKKQ